MAAIVALAAAAVLLQTTAAMPQQSARRFRVLAFTKTVEFRQRRSLSRFRHCASSARGTGSRSTRPRIPRRSPTESGALRRVAFVLTTGDVLDDEHQAAFQRYIRGGHGFVGVHFCGRHGARLAVVRTPRRTSSRTIR